jgi:hypothetical protein
VRCSKTTWSPGAVSAEITAIAPACTPSVGMMVSGAGEAIAGQPFAAGGKPMVGKTRRIAGQPLRIFARGLGQQFGDDYALADIRRARRDRNESCRAGRRSGGCRRHARPDRWPARAAQPTVAPALGAAPDLAADQSAFAQQRIGATDRTDSGAQIEGEVALRRNFAPAGIEPASISDSMLSASRW